MATVSDKKRSPGTLLVVDGHSLAFRAFFALPVDNFTTSKGLPTNAIWGFTNMLAQVVEKEEPDRLAVAFDMAGGTFRNKMLPDYKGTRDAAPEELLAQLPIIQELLEAMGVTYIEKPGYEGDDIIGTLASMGQEAGYKTLVLSGDRDAFQLIDDHVTVLYPGHHFKDLKHMDAQAIIDKYKVEPWQYPDLAAIRGETSDNIPGVPGVGDGYAARWINQYGSLESILEHADEIPGKKGEALRANIDQVRLNRKVNALVRDLDLGCGIDDFSFHDFHKDKLATLFKQLELGTRTKQRIMRVFGKTLGLSSLPAGEDDEEESGENSVYLNDPDKVDIADVKAMQSWADQTIKPLKAARDAADQAAAQEEASLSAETDGAEAAPVQGDQVNKDADKGKDGADPASSGHQQAPADRRKYCGKALDHSWVLQAEGSSKPGKAHLDRVVLLANDQVVTLEAPFDQTILEQLQSLLDQYHETLVVHGYKEHLHLMASAGLRMSQPFFDTKLAGYLVHPDFHADNLEQAAKHFLQIAMKEEGAVTQGQLDLDSTGDEQLDPETEIRIKSIRHAVIVRALSHKLAPLLDQRFQFSLLHDMELPVSRILYTMENHGACVDLQRLTGLRDQFAAEAAQAQQIAWDSAGNLVNLQSPKQLQKVLFEDMQLRPTKKTKSGSYTTNSAALQELYLKTTDNEKASNFLGALLRHRETNKLKQIVQSLIDTVNKDDGRIHTTYEQTVAATGRLSSVDPNLQNIPNRNAAGREIRSGFVTGDGYEALLSCDYSQVELRIMADLSGDEALIEAFKSGTDFHKYVASLVYGVPIDEISSDQRSHVKAMSYGLAYGLSTYGLAQQLKISPAAADVLKDQYFATFGKVHTYLESLVTKAREDGYTETIFGRRRYFPELRSQNRNRRDAAERAALNAPIQGSAADIMKLAMIRADKALRDAGVNSRIILQIHDELVLEVAAGEAEQASKLVKDAMEHAVDLAVPLNVSIGIGKDWQSAAH
ncbi:DNA polymerase I [Bifidobacterium aemilianum]|uniref:DNA polymerase I n=1 Tax=Bifidobacterium aemilianum TaxID=2493120 RepID=A0A366KAB7_9BIFI|nr:DNA polymerase I [Bifidobacterium aemilianum]RBP98654.1 DNA polymerase I [Bifidobacterium aemilianum]